MRKFAKCTNQVERYETVEQYLEDLSKETGIDIDKLRKQYKCS